MVRWMARIAIGGAIVVLGVARPALAGPPLLCHPYEIGAAQSLPWQGKTWWPATHDYDVANLVNDVTRLLTPDMPVIVRMETLRRATIYATADRNVAANLLNGVVKRAAMAERHGYPDALLWLDAAYVAEALREVQQLAQMSSNRQFLPAVKATAGVADGVDGYAFILKSLALRPDDPAIEFAAALIAARETGQSGPPAKYVEHAAKARAGATRDALLARNLDHVQ